MFRVSENHLSRPAVVVCCRVAFLLLCLFERKIRFFLANICVSSCCSRSEKRSLNLYLCARTGEIIRLACLGAIVGLFSSAVFAEQRIALVIGNGSYANAPLNNPENDAGDMSVALQGHGFSVTTLINGSRREMEDSIRAFARQLRDGTVGLFYYAGHGLQLDGENYLVPVDARIELESDVRYEAVALGRLLEGMQRSGSGLNLVLLDACRNNPYASGFRSSSRGLTREAPVTGTMILYATEPGRVAADGIGRNGVFTGEFLEMLKTHSDLKIEQLFKRTSRKVYEKTGGAQSPWSEGVIRGDFAFRIDEKSSAPSIGSGLISTQTASSISADSLELALWQAAQRGGSIQHYEIYLRQFPQGTFSGFAEIELKRLREDRFRVEKQAQLQSDLEKEQLRHEEIRLAEQALQEEKQRRELQRDERLLGLSKDVRRQVQLALNKAGFNVGIADGLWGPKTRAGLRQWQKSVKLQETGYLNRDSYQLFVAEMPVAPLPTPSPKLLVPELVKIPAGNLLMGSNDGLENEKPVHKVFLQAFEMGKYEVTFDEYAVFVRGASGSIPNDQGWGRERRPAIHVSWDDAQAYVKWLSKETGDTFRLPTEAEWEYAARGGNMANWSFGNDDGEVALYGNSNNADDKFKYTAPVGSYLPNHYGLYDMHGNVWEWTSDCWHENYKGAPNDGSSRSSEKECKLKVLRGGSWVNGATQLRSSHRYWNYASNGDNNVGFRVVKVPTP